MAWTSGGAERSRGRCLRQVFLGGRPDAVPEAYRLASPHALLPLGVPTLLVNGARPALRHITAATLCLPRHPPPSSRSIRIEFSG